MNKKVENKQVARKNEESSQGMRKYKTEAVESDERTQKSYTMMSNNTQNNYIYEGDSWKDRKRDSIKGKIENK